MSLSLKNSDFQESLLKLVGGPIALNLTPLILARRPHTVPSGRGSETVAEPRPQGANAPREPRPFYHSTRSSASQKKYSPHMTDSSTPRPLCTWYTPPLRMPSHLPSGLASCSSHSDRRIRTAVDQYRSPFIESGASRHRRSSPAAQIAADEASPGARFSTGPLITQGG